MGTLIYNDMIQLQLDDARLAHVRFVVFEKLRKKEPFPLTWVERREGATPQSTSVWVAPEIPIGFTVEGLDDKQLSREEVQELMRMSYTNRGLVIEVPAQSAA